MTQSWGNIGIALRHSNYRNYQAGRFLSHTASWMYKLAIGWLVWKMTHSAAWLGVFGFLDQAPALFIMPLAGALTDRIDALKMLRITQVLLAVQGVLLALLDWFDLLNLPILIVMTLFYGIVSAFQLPANQTILPNLMPRNALTVAYGLNSVFYNVARFAGPMLAGVVISAWGTAPAIMCNAIGALLFLCVLVYLAGKIDIPRQERRSPSSSVLAEIREGFSYTMNHGGVRPAVVILSALSLFPYTVEMILPSLADGVYKMGAFGLAWMTAMLGVGAMAQATLIARRGGVSGLSAYAIQAILWMGLAFCVIAFVSNFWLALVCVFVIGFTASATRVSSMTLLQYCVEPSMRGRVASIYGLITHFFPAAGALLVGALGDRLGLPTVMGVIGLFTLLIWLWAFLRRHDMARALEVEHHREPR